MFKEERTDLRFEWSDLGDIQVGRPNLGAMTSVAAYRLMQFTMRDAMIRRVGVAAANEILYEAGHEAGTALYANLLDAPTDLGEFVSRLQRTLEEQRIGILRIEEADPEALRFTLTVAEDLDCSGLPMIDEAICVYDEGFIAGLLEAFTGRAFVVKEVDCWCTGDRVCRFQAHLAE